MAVPNTFSPNTQIKSAQVNENNTYITNLLDGTNTSGISPKKVATDMIVDANGNEEIKFVTTASAVNEFQFTNAATGNPPEIAATGGDTNIDVRVKPKGTGRFNFTSACLEVPIYSPNAESNWNTFDFVGLGSPRLQSSASVGSSIRWDMFIEAGTYRLDLIHTNGNNRGIYTIVLDGSLGGVSDVNPGTIDGYDAGAGAVVRSTITGIVVPVSAKYGITLTMATKNGSSIAYYGIIHFLGLARTGA